jgi:hypothetical protein
MIILSFSSSKINGISQKSQFRNILKISILRAASRFQTILFSWKYWFSYLIIFPKFSLLPSYCNVTFRNFPIFSFLKNVYSLGKFPSLHYFSILKKYLRVSNVHILLNLATFMMFLFPETFVLSNTD